MGRLFGGPANWLTWSDFAQGDMLRPAAGFAAAS
jgi:hypothetical protein